MEIPVIRQILNHSKFNSVDHGIEVNLCMFWRYLLYAFLIYLAYRFIFHFLIPIYQTTKQVKKQFRDMHSQMNQQQANQRSSTPTPETKKEHTGGDYIDFEEVK